MADKATGKDFVPKYAGRFTPQEDAFILNNRHKMTQAELGKAIKRSKESVRARLVYLKAKGEMVNYKRQWKTRQKNNSYVGVKIWTEAEDQYLRENWGRPRKPDEKGWGNRVTCKEIAEHLKRSEQGTWSRASRLGLVNYMTNKRKQSA